MVAPRLPVTIQQDLTAEDCRRLARSSITAVDVETTGLNPLRDHLCLVQIADVERNVTLVRARQWRSAANLCAFLVDGDIQKLFHFALFDCSFISRHLGIEVANPYCTKIASKLARTYSDHHGLATLAQELCGVALDKSQQMTDWCADEVSASQLDYAANDVVWLFDIKEKLDAKLIQRGQLPSGISYTALNQRCQAFIPTLVQLQLNTWGDVVNGDIPIFAR